MWDDITIGKTSKSGSAMLIRDLPDGSHISGNGHEYWITYKYLGIGMKIERLTEEGKHLTKLLADKDEDDVVVKWLRDLSFEKLTIESLQAIFERKTEDAFRKGREYQAMEMRRALLMA